MARLSGVSDQFSLNTTLTVDRSQYVAGLKAAAKATKNFEKQVAGAGSQVSRQMQQASRATQQYAQYSKKSFKDVTRIIQGILVAQGFYALARAIRGTITETKRLAQTFEQLKISFRLLLGDAAKANQLFAQIEDHAARTPFELEEAAQASRKLLAVGYDASETLKILQDITDVTAVSGADPEVLQRIIDALTKIRTTGKVTMRELNRFAYAGIPVYEILREELGLTAKQIQNIGKENISAARAVNAILAGIQKRYKGAADEISKSVGGLLSTIKDNFFLVMIDLTEGLYESYRNMIEQIADTLQEFRDIVREFGAGGLLNEIFGPETADAIRLVLANIRGLMGALRELAMAIMPTFNKAMLALTYVFNSVAPIIKIVIDALTVLMQVFNMSVIGPRLLGTALAGLLIGITVARVFVVLRKAIIGLSIASVVAKAVAALSKAMAAFNVILATNPIVAICIAIAAALAAIAVQSGYAAKLVNELQKQLAQLASIDTDVLEPEDNAGDDAIDIADQISDAYEDMGDEAEKAGKKAKGAIAAFDEVYQLKDKSALGGGYPFQAPDVDLKLPEVKFDVDEMKDRTEEIVDHFHEFMEKMREALAPPLEPPIPPPGVTVVAFEEWLIALQAGGFNVIAWLQQFKEQVKKAASDVWAPIPEAAAAILPQLEDVMRDFEDVLNVGLDVSVDFTHSISGWPVALGNTFASMLEAVETFKTGFAETISGLVTEVNTTLVPWLEDLKANQFGQFFVDVRFAQDQFNADLIVNFTDTLAQASQVVESSTSSISSFFFQMWGDIDHFNDDGMDGMEGALTAFTIRTATILRQWASDVPGVVSIVWDNLSQVVRESTQSMEESINGWAEGVTLTFIETWQSIINTFNTGVTAVQATLKGWITTTHTMLVNWGASMEEFINGWAENTMLVFTETWQSVTVTFNVGLKTTQAAVSSWIKDTRGMIVNWGSNMKASISQTWSSIVTSTVQSVNNIRTSIITGFNNAYAATVQWVQNMYGQISTGFVNITSSVAGAIGEILQTVLNFFGNMRENIMTFFANVLSWLGDHKTEVLAAVGLIIAGVLAWWAGLPTAIMGILTSMGATILAWLAQFGISFADDTETELGKTTSAFESFKESVLGIFTTIKEKVGKIWSATIDKISDALESLRKLGRFIPGFESIYGKPGTKLAKGGIVRRSTYAEIGEGKDPEAVLPLNTQSLKPLADILSSQINTQPGTTRETVREAPTTTPQIIVYNMIADERGLRELKKKFDLIDMSERERRD